jgi:predicted peptidase
MCAPTHVAVLSALWLLQGLAFAQPARTTERPAGTTDAPYGFVEYLPEGYAPDGPLFPLLVMLHGIDERGDGRASLGRVRIHGPNKEVDLRRRALPFVLLTPQSPTAWDTERLDAFFRWALGRYRVDAHRTWLTGLSMGGGGAWEYAAAHPERLAAVVPLCGASRAATFEAGRAIVDGGVAVWATHARDDRVVPLRLSEQWMDAVGAALGVRDRVLERYPVLPNATWTARVESGRWGWAEGQHADFAERYLLTVYPSGNHLTWARLYSDPSLYDWLMRQARP